RFGAQASFTEFDCLGLCLHEQCRDASGPLDDRARGLPENDAAEPHAAAGMGAAADFDDVGVTGEQTYLVDGDTEPLVEQLSETRLVPLSIRYRADNDIDAAIGVHGELCALARNAGCGIHVVG